MTNNRQSAVSLCSSALDAVGGTPTVDLSRLCQHLSLPPYKRIIAKLDNLSIGSSKKDRIAKQIILDAIEDKSLKPGQTVCELTSGNTGTGLAIACAVLGFPFVAVMSKGNSIERARMMRALGAEVVLVDQEEGSAVGQVSGGDLDKVEEVANQIVKDRGAFRADQFLLNGSIKAHYENTGPEAWDVCNEIDGFCDFIGSGGTFIGVTKFLKEKTDDQCKCFVLEPTGVDVLNYSKDDENAIMAEGDGGHKIQGGGYSKNFSNLPLFGNDDGKAVKNKIDGFLQVTNDEAMEMSRLLAKKEGIFGGFSAGANIAGAVKLLRNENANVNCVLVLVCDNGLKYLSTDLWE